MPVLSKIVFKTVLGKLSPFGGVEAEVAIGVGGYLEKGTGTAGGEVCIYLLE